MESQPENQKKPYHVSILTNTAIIILFFFTFCEIESCNKGKPTHFSGFGLILASFLLILKFKKLGFVLLTILFTFLSSLMGLWSNFSNMEKLAKRMVFISVFGIINMLLFILFVLGLPKGTSLNWVPFVIIGLQTTNLVYYVIQLKKAHLKEV